MSKPFRLSSGGIVDRDTPISFEFNNRAYSGFKGDTLASALLANGVHLVARSLRYHRPRGIMAFGPEEPCALVGLNTGPLSEPNSRVTELDLTKSLTAHSHNCWPSVEFDIFRFVEKFSRFLGPGFYYKSFMWPKRAWLLYEKLFSRAAGFGKAPPGRDPNSYEKRNLHIDILVVGAGPAGLAAAATAVKSGATTLLVDENSHWGGSLWDNEVTINDISGRQWTAETLGELKSHDNFMCLSRATVFGIYDHNLVGIIERGVIEPDGPDANCFRYRCWKVRARQIVLATGSIERVLVFKNNDRPGIMLANAVRSYLHRYSVLCGQKAIVFTNNDNAYRTALDLLSAGVEIEGIIDLRNDINSPLVRQARSLGITVYTGYGVIDTSGSRRIDGLTMARVDAQGKADLSAVLSLSCDLLCVSGGHVPAVQLHSQVTGPLEYSEPLGAFVPASDLPSIRSVGGCNGDFSVASCLSGGAAAGAEAASLAGFAKPVPDVEYESKETKESPALNTWIVSANAGFEKCFVDFQNDVTIDTLRQTVKEGFHSIEHVKRYTALNMGTDQGKIGALLGTAVVASELDVPLRDVGVTTYRPPYIPVSIGALIGADQAVNTYPTRRTALYQWHIDNGGVFSPGAGWKRPDAYVRPGESFDDAVQREAITVRNAIGIMDVGTVGKFELQGPDVVEFLQRIWVNRWDNIEMGRGKYWIMLRDDGMIFDDGMAVRLGENHFYVNSTSANQDRFYARLEYLLQTQWPDLEVMVTPVIEQWFTLALSGPRARDVLEKASDNLDVSNQAFPIISVRESEVCEIPSRILRMSFSGELCYEISVSADYGVHLWKSLLTVGEPYGIIPYGLEAANILRIEKGHFIVGFDADGRTSIADVGLEKMIDRSKNFVGKLALDLPGMRQDTRMQLVGLVMDPSQKKFPVGAVLSEPGCNNPFLGKVTSACWSAELDRPIALGLLRRGRSYVGKELEALSPMTGESALVQVTEPIFYDKGNARSHG